MKSSSGARRSLTLSFVSKSLIFCLALSLLIGFGGTLPPAASSNGVNAKAASHALTAAQGADAAGACPTCSSPAQAGRQHLLAATYYSLRGSMSATLMLNNKAPQPLDVQPTLFSLSGARTSVPTVTIPGNSFREINLRDWTGGDDSFREGSIQVSYAGADLMLGAQVYLTDAAHSLVFEEKFSEPAAQFASSRLEGVWWLPSQHSTARLVVSNTTDAVLTVNARAEGTAPPQREAAQFNLLPHETRVLDILADLVGARGALLRAGGVSLSHSGAGGALLARLYVEDAERGYSSWARFTDPAKGKSTSYQGAGLRLGTAAGERLTPVVVARNAGDAETTITGRIPYTLKDGTAGVVELPALRLAPGEADTVDMTAALARSHIERKVETAGLEFEHTGAAGSVLFGAQSVSESLNQVFQVPLWDLEAQRSATGGYPWKVEGDASTVVYIKNVTDRAQQFFMQLNYAGADGSIAGTYATGLKSVPAHQTVAYDLRAIRDSQAPDEHGHTIPLTATRGQLHWSMRGSENLVLIGRAEQVDTAHGIASSYACQNCCPDSFYDALTSDCLEPTFVNTTSQLFTTERDRDCYGSIYGYDANDLVFDWFSSAADIATVDEAGLAEGVSPGTAGLHARLYATTWYMDLVHGYCRASYQQVVANAICDVLRPPVIFKEVTWSDQKATFSYPENRATLNLGGDRLTEQACGGQQFSINVTFRQPDDSAGCCHSAIDNFVKAPNSEFVVLGSEFYEEGTTSGQVSVTLKRFGEGTKKIVIITVGGSYQSGSSWTSSGTVSLQCP